jgi:hypothetical protein
MARLIRVVLEGKELHILHALVLAQVCEKAPQPRCSSLRIGAGLDFLVHSLKAGPPSFNAGSTWCSAVAY